MKRKTAGFSLVELMVVITVLGILAAIIYVNFSQAGASSRDAERQSNLRLLQNAVELYKQENGRYPEQCANSRDWAGQVGSFYECSDGTGQYIVGLAPKYIKVLPAEPKLNGNRSGYMYKVNADGTVYKIVTKATVESEVVDDTHEFKSCDVSPGICDNLQSGSPKPNQCRNDNIQFQTTYGVWGGWADPGLDPSHPQYDSRVEEYTEDVICDTQ